MTEKNKECKHCNGTGIMSHLGWDFDCLYCTVEKTKDDN